MKCPSCGAEFAVVGKFCPKCGAKIEQPEVVQEVAEQVAAPVSEAVAVAEATEVIDPINEATEVLESVVEPVVEPVVKQAAPVASAPVYQNTTVTPKAPVAPAKKGVKKAGVGVKIGVALLAILLFITSIASVLIYDVRNTFEKDNIEKIIESVDVVELCVDNELVSESDWQLFCNDMRDAAGLSVTVEKLDEFINDSTAKSVLAKKVHSFFDDATSGDDAEITITYSDIMNLLYENDEAIYDAFGRSLTYTEKDNITYWFMGDSYENSLVVSDDLEDKASVAYNVATKALSKVTMIIAIAVSVIIIAIMMIINLRAGFCGTGIVFVIIGVLMAVAAPLVGKLIMGGTLVGTIVGEVAMMNIIPAAVILVVGVALLVVRGFALKPRR